MDHLNVWENISGIVEKYTYVFPTGAEVDINNPCMIFRREDGERLVRCVDKSVVTINSTWIYARTFFTKEYLESRKGTGEFLEEEEEKQ